MKDVALNASEMWAHICVWSLFPHFKMLFGTLLLYYDYFSTNWHLQYSNACFKRCLAARIISEDGSCALAYLLQYERFSKWNNPDKNELLVPSIVWNFRICTDAIMTIRYWTYRASIILVLGPSWWESFLLAPFVLRFFALAHILRLLRCVRWQSAWD